MAKSDSNSNNSQPPLSLGTAAARQLATTSKSVPQMQGITSRWLLKLLPWVQVSGGVYRVNRRLSYAVGDGQLTFYNTGDTVQVVPRDLREMPLLRELDDESVLTSLADLFVQKNLTPGDVLVEMGQPADQIILIAHGKVQKAVPGEYDDEVILEVLTGGDYFSYQALRESSDPWSFTAKALTSCTVLTLSRKSFEKLADQAETLRAHIDDLKQRPPLPADKYGQEPIELAAGHVGEPALPSTYVDYDIAPREYELSVAQTVLNVHSRVADLYNDPMNQTEQQLRLTIEELLEKQEHQMINNREFGLLHNADIGQRISTRTGPPAPDDLDELIARRRNPQLLFAHPRAIAAFGRECNQRGLYPQSIDMEGHMVPTWRGIPLLPCNKIPISRTQTSSILALRTGEDNQGVIGLQPANLPDEYQPGLNVRFMGINEKAVISYLISAYFSVAILVPDALGVLEDVEIGH